MKGVTFVVVGESVSQGSHKGFRNPKTNGVIITDAKKGLKPWRKKVADLAAAAFDGRELLEGPVRVRARFIFERPASHYGTGRNAGVLKASAPKLFITSHAKGDLDKHLRSMLDALTGVVFKDDSQVAVIESAKVYGADSSCIVEVTPLEE